MRFNTHKRRLPGSGALLRSGATAALVVLFIFVSNSAYGRISWDGDAGTQWWFDPANWSLDNNDAIRLPPGNATTGATDTQIGFDTSNAPQGVLYDPEADPNFPPTTVTFPLGFGPQTIRELYITRNTTVSNLLTIDGDLEMTAIVRLGRSSGVDGVLTHGRINQTDGLVTVNNASMEIGGTDTSHLGYSTGTYDYRGGTLEVAFDGGEGIQLSHGGSAGTGGTGRFIMRNPTSGYVRTYDFEFASHLGIANVGLGRNANGIDRGVAVAEFHYENGGTQPIQVLHDLVINNGMFTNTSGITGTRSARLELVLDEAPALDAGVPENLGLFDVDFFDPDQLVDPIGTNHTGVGALEDYFSSADGSIHYTPGSMVSATFGSTQYNWTISYSGEITWLDPDLGTLDSVSDTGGLDIVLVGHSSVSLGVDGDYNNDGKVDAADYVVFRKNAGTMNTLPNDPHGGTIDQDQYNTWRANFGLMASGAGAGSSAAIPEPSALVLAMIALALSIRQRKSH